MLELQGGPRSAHEAKEFSVPPYAQNAIALRRLDDAAKVAGLADPGLEGCCSVVKSLGGVFDLLFIRRMHTKS